MMETEQTTWYHGGVPGLRIGDWILPPSETGVKGMDAVEFMPGDLKATPDDVHRPDRVCMVSDLEQALLFAAFFPGGSQFRGGDVYKVEPFGRIEPDPDWLGDEGVSVRAVKARVVDVVKRGIDRTPYLSLLALG